MEGDFLTLHTEAEPEKDSEAVWFFKGEHLTTRVAQMNKGTVTYFEQGLSGRLHLDQESGSLTIWNISTSDSGLYKVTLTMKLYISEMKFKVNVYGKLQLLHIY